MADNQTPLAAPSQSQPTRDQIHIATTPRALIRAAEQLMTKTAEKQLAAEGKAAGR